MNKLFESADRYLAQSDWKDLAVMKFCMFSVGAFVGSFAVSKKHRAAVRAVSAGVFTVTYIPLMHKYFTVVREMFEEGEL